MYIIRNVGNNQKCKFTYKKSKTWQITWVGLEFMAVPISKKW